jgi:uncharacterized repeat protein (TIGR01451 family)
MLTPTRMIAPVGSEVVLVSGLCGDDGYLITQQPIEFMLSQDSVGQFVEVSDQERLWCRSRKLSADYAIARTSTRSQVVTRGTPSVTDDVVQDKGQCWVSLTSSSPGTSYVTAVAKKGANWPQRRQAATIYWVDAQWAFPNPVAVPAGRPHTLSTSVKRTATGAPVVGFIVRYELVDGAPAAFGSGASAIEVMTDQDGLGNAVLQPTTNDAGTSQVRIQVIKPADPNSDAPRTQLGEGYTSITWSAPGLALRATGPPSGLVDGTLVYQLEVQNPGDLPSQNVEVRGVIPPSLKYISTNPPAQVLGNQVVWQVAEIPPKGVRAVQVNVRADAAGDVRFRFEATSGAMRAEAHVDTQITRPSLSLDVDGPTTAAVGDRVEFRIDVTNNGQAALEDVVIRDSFDDSLQHADGLASPIQKSLGRFEPGQTKTFAVTFLVRRAGQICHALEVTAPGGQYAQQQVCLTVAQPEVPSRPTLSVTKTAAPTTAQVGQRIQFTSVVTNTGNIPLTNVRVADVYDDVLVPERATPGSDNATFLAGEGLLWVFDRLEPGQSAELQVLCQGSAEGEATSRVSVTANEGIAEAAQASVRIVPAAQLQPGTGSPGQPPVAAGQIQVDIYKLGDPIAAGDETVYRIHVKNARAVPDQDIDVTIEFPPGLQFRRLLGVGQKPVIRGRTVQFARILEMRPNETVNSLRVEAVGVEEGTHTVRVTVRSRLSPNGVTAEAKTTVTAQ